MPVVRHSPGVEQVDWSGEVRWRPTCGCGHVFKGKSWELPRTEERALKQAEQHAAQKGCGKARFSEQEADAALIDAKIAHGLLHNARRQEQRKYLCPDCPGEVWHLTKNTKERV